MKKAFVILMIICLSLFVSGQTVNATHDYRILNSPTATKEQILTWAENVNANDLFKTFIDIGYDIAVEYEVDPTVLLAQTAIETGYGKFGGVIDSSYKNTAGIKTSKGGSNNNPNAHKRFDSWEDSFIAQAQHLRLYAGKETSKDEVLDPRHFKEIKGKATTVNALSKKWATNSNYGIALNNLCEDIVNTKTNNNINSNNNINNNSIDNNPTNENISLKDRIKKMILEHKTYSKDYIKNKIFSKKNKQVNKEHIYDLFFYK